MNFATSLIGVMLLAALAPTLVAQARSVEAVRTRTQDLSRTVELPATLEPWEQVTLASRVSGHVVELAAERGDRVAAQALLARVDVPEMRGELAAAEADVVRARAEAELATALLDQLRAAHQADAGSVSAQELHIAEAEAKIAAARAGSASAERQRLLALEGLAAVKAPFAGVISRRHVSPGALVSANSASTPLFTLVQDDRLRAIVDVPEFDAAGLVPGRSARVSIRAAAQVRTAQVSRVAGRLDATTRTLRVEVDLENADHALRPGSYAEVQLDVEVRPGVVVVPASAVVTQGETSFVFLLLEQAGGVVARRQEVVTGLATGERIEVAAGLPADVLVAAQPRSVTEGQRFESLQERSSW